MRFGLENGVYTAYAVQLINKAVPVFTGSKLIAAFVLATVKRRGRVVKGMGHHDHV